MNCSEQIGSFIAALRKEKGLTQEDLAMQLHITKQAVSRWERGVGYPDIGILESLATLLDVGIDELINGKRNQNTDDHAEAITAIRRIISISMNQKADRRYRMLTITEIITCVIGVLCIVYSSQYSIAMYLSLRPYIMYTLGAGELGLRLPKNPPTEYYYLYAGLFFLFVCFICLVYQAIQMRRVIRNVDDCINDSDIDPHRKSMPQKGDQHENIYKQIQNCDSGDTNFIDDGHARSGSQSDTE